MAMTTKTTTTQRTPDTATSDAPRTRPIGWAGRFNLPSASGPRALSRGAATVISQGRKPLGEGRTEPGSPEGATEGSIAARRLP